MNIKDLNFLAPEINAIKPEEKLNLSSPVNFFQNVDTISKNSETPNRHYDWKQDLSNYVAKDKSTPIRESYYNTKQYEKYHSALFGNSEFKDPSYYDNEELFSQKQGFFGSLLNGTIKMIPSFASSFVSTFNPVGYDNKLSNAMMDFSEKMENWFPNYYSKDERDNPMAFRNIMSGNFIGDKLVKNLGFMGGAMTAAILQDAIIGTVTGGTALAPTIALQTGRAANWLQKAFKAETIASKLVTTGRTGEFLTNTILKGNKALEYFNAMSKGQKVLTGVKTTAFLAAASHGEAAIEALEGYRTIKNDLIKSHIDKYGEEPNSLEMQDIENIASESANIRYGLNFATIFLSDAIQFSSLFKPLAGYTVGNTLLEGIGGNAKRLALNEAGQLARRELTRSQKIIGGLTGELMRDNITEMFQEGLQYSFDKAADSYAKKKWNHEIRGGFGDYLKEQGEGLKRMVGDTEGQESMLLGFLTGFVAHGFKKGVEIIKGIDKKVEERENLIIDEFNNIDFNKLFDVNAFNEMVARDSELFNGRTTQEIILHQMRDAIANNDTLAFKSLKHEQLFNVVRTANALGKFDAFLEKLDTLKELPDEEFKNLFGIPKTESKTVDEYVDKLKNEANKIKDLVDQIDSTMENPFDKNSMEFIAFNDMKDTMSFHLSYINNINNRVDSITDKLLTDNPSLTEDLIYNMADLENFQTKFLQPLNQERQELYESYKLMSEMKEGRDEVLYKETQDKLKTLDKHIDLLNNHLKDFSEAGDKELYKAQIGAYKNIVLEVLRYNHEKYTGQPFAFTQNQLEDTLHALIDFQKLKTTLGSIVDSSNKFQTPEGRQKFMNEHMKFLNVYSQGFLKSIKEANFENLKKYKEEHLSGIKNEINSNLSEVQKINEQLQSLNEQLKDVEDKTEIKKQIDELKEQKDKILKENQELEKVADALENDKELDEDTNLEKRKKEIEYSIDQLEKDIEDRKKELIKNGASEKDAEKIARKEFNESDGGKNKIALEKLYDELDKINNQLEQKDDEKEVVEESKDVGTPIEVQPKEVVVTTPTPIVDLDLESKEDEFIAQIDKQEFNGRVHFLRTTDVEKNDRSEKDGKGGRTRRFQLFLEQFLISNGLSQVENLNNWLSNNNLKFVIMRPTDEMYDDRTFDEKYKTLDNQSKSAVLVLVDKDNKPVKLKDGEIDDSGDFVAEVLPTKKEKSKWNDQLQYIHDSEYKQLHNAVNSIKSSENPSPITVNITGVADGLYRFMTDVNGKVDKNPSPLTKSILDNPASELFVNTSSEDIKFGGFNLQRGKLYLKVSNEDKTYFYFPIQLGKISETKLGNSIHSILEYVFKNHKTLKEENDTLLKDIDLFLETVLYNGVKINNLGLEINFHLNSENPYFKIERVDKENKTQTLLYDLDSLTSDKKLFLNFLKGLDINSKTFDKSEQIEVPILDKNGLRIEKQSYKDFILENTNPTIPFKIDLSKGFDRVKQAVFFNIDDTQNSLLEDTQSGIKSTKIDENIPELVQSDIEAKNADIERRIQEEGIAALKAIKPGYNAFEDNGNAENTTKALGYVYKLFGIEGYPEQSNFTVKNTAKSLSLDKVKENFLYHIIAGADRTLLWKVVPFFAQNIDKIDNKNKAYLSVLIRWYNKELSDSEKEVNKYFNSNQANIDKANGAFYYQAMLSERKRVSLGYLPMLNVPNDREIFKRYNDYYSSLEQKNAMSESSQQSKERYYKAVENVIINAKYNTELAALEQPTTSNQSEIEVKKADIERRRQEELEATKLNNSLSEFELENTPDLKTGSTSKRFKIKKDGKEVGIVSLNIDENGNVRIAYMEINPSNRRKGLAENFYKDLNKALQKNKQGVLYSDKVFLDELSEWERMKKRGELRKWILDGKELSKDEIDALKKNIDKVIELQDSGRLVTEEVEDLQEVLPAQKMWEKLVEKGFAEKLEDGTYRFKYDAELAELGKIQPKETIPNVEAKKADIEKDQQGNFVPKKYTLNLKGENPSPNIPLSAISEESFGGELPTNVKQVKLLEIRGKNSLGQTVGEVWVQKEDGQSYTVDVIFNDVELATLESKNVEPQTSKIEETNSSKEVIVKKDAKSNWTLIVNPDGTVINKNTKEAVTDKNLINKAHLKSGFVKYEKIIANNKKEYALTEDGRVISLNQSSLGKELDTETSSIAKDVLSKGKIHLKEEIKSDNPSISTDGSTLTQDVTEDKPKEKKKFNKNNDSTPLFSSKKIPVLPSLNVTETDIEKVRSLFSHEVNIKNLFNIANSDAWAIWSQSAITLFKGATRADLYHEAWHHFSQLYLTKDEKVRLYSETRQRVKELIGKSDLEVEEYIAREFAKFTETGKIEGNYPERKSIFQKIMDFLKSIFSNETDLSLDSLFNNLYKGQVNPLNYSTDNIMFGKLNSSINDNFSASETDVLFPALDALKSQLLKEYNVSDSEMYKIKNVNRIYNEIQDHIIELYEKSENPIITSKLEKVLDNWEDVKKSHLEYVAKQRGIKSEVEIDENGQLSFKDENEDEKQGRNSADFSEGSEKTIYDLMDEDVKSLIRGLVDKDSKGNEIVDPIFGLPRLVDFSKYVELLKDSFDDSQNLNQMLEKMTELSKKYPAIKDLIDRLFVNESNDVKNLRIKFVSSLGLVKNPIIQGLVNENKVITSVQASTSKKREAEYDTKAYFYQAKPTSLIESVDGENVIKSAKLETIKNYNIVEQKDQINFLKDIGIEIDNLLPNLENRDKKLLFNLNTFQYLKDHIVKYLSEKGDIKNIIDALQTTLKDGKKEDKVYKLLVNLKQKRLPQYISGAYLNAANKLEQEKTQWSTMDKVLVALSKSKSIQDLTNDPNLVHLKGFLDGSYLDMQSSKLLSYLYNENGTRTSNKLTKNNYNGIASTDENKDGLKTKTMYIKDKVLMDIALFANSNHLTTMQLSNKASHFTFGFDKVLIDNETEFVNAMYGYLLDELKIIKEFDNGNEELTKLKKLKGNILKDGKYQFAIFKDIITATENNPDFAQDVINQYLKNGELKEDVRAAVVKQIKDFLNKELNSTFNFIGSDFLSELKVDENNRRYKGLDNRLILKDYIQNQLVFNIEMSKLVFGNPYMHTDPFKRIAGASSTGRSILSDDVSIEYYKQMTTSTQRSKVLDTLHSKVGGEYKLQTRKSEKEIRYFVAKDREIQSDYYNSILKLIDEQIAKNPDNLELKEKRKAIESAYNKVNGSDAMGACTLDFWRKSSILSGRWDFKSLEPFYQKMINWDYYNRLMKSTEDSEKKLEYFTERQKNELTDDEIINVAVLKYQYYGTVENNSIAEKAFHKFQLMPLIPQVIEGKNWSNHLDRMIYEDVDYMMFESASKLERDDVLDDFYIENSNKSAGFNSSISKYRNGTNSYNIKTGFLDNLKEQVFMENGVDDSLLFGSQVRKLLFNADDFSDLYDEFRNTIQSLTDIEKDNLKKLSGLDEEGKVTDNQKFVKFLLDEIDKKTVNKNVKEYLRLTNEGNFAHSLDTNIQRQPIESIINSVINSRLIKQKMHGEMLVQVSNVGFESLEDGKGLKFYSLENGKVRKMQVKVPLTGKFKNLLNLVIDGQKVGTRERLNQLLKEGKIDTRAITMVGYRIPTQEHNSIEIMEVEEFLHPSLNAIIVPYEITAKAGSDFDIDKLNIFKPHIDSDGNYIDENFVTEEKANKVRVFLEDKILKKEGLKNSADIFTTIASEKLINDIFGTTSQELEEEIQEIFKENKVPSTEEIQQRFKKNFYQNKIIEIFEKVLLDPSNYLNLITPNSTFMFDEAMDNIFIARYSADEIQTKKGKKLPKDLNMTYSLTPRSSWITSKILFEAASALGIAAVGNTFTQLIQKSNVEFTESYLSKFNLLFKPESISKRTLSNGLSKATAYSQLINIYVDIANDPRAGYLNMGDRVTPIINTMINMGLPIDTILYFINQPIIRDFVEYEGMIKNSLFKGKEKVNVYKEFIKTVSESSKYDFGSVVGLTENLEEGYVNYSRFIESKQTYADISSLLQKEGVEHDFSNERLKNTLTPSKESTVKERENYSKEQLLLLSQYLQLSEISSDYRQLQSSMNFDTTLAKDGFDSEERERLFNEVVKKDIFTNLGDLKNKTVIAPLNISNYLTNVNKKLLPLTNSTIFYNFLSEKLSANYQYSTTKVKSRFVRTFKNDLISYIFQNFVTRSDKASLLFNETFAPVLGEYENKPNEFGLYLVKNLYKDLIKLRNENPELKNQYSILDKLFIISENEFKNIGLSYFNKDSQLQDSYIEQFKELLNHQNLEVRNFMLKFAYMSFFQSGLNKSFISSSDIIPAYIFAPILDAVREQFYKEVNSPAKENAVLEDFFKKFLQNNDRFRANDDNRGKSDKNILKEKSDRGKWYVSNVGEVLNPALSTLNKEKIDLAQAVEFEGYYILDNKVYNNQGIEVYNPDILQDFKLEKIKPSDEQQKVIDKIKEFIKSSDKELLSPENVLMISGAGGTGKTFSITRAARQLQKEKYVSIAFSAPTHNAKRELQKSLDDVYGKNRETAYTNASLFALDYNPITGKTTKRIINDSFPPEYWNKSVIILDEYSMLGGELWKMIQERLEEKVQKGYGHTKIIFTGDYAQIPVPDSSRKEFMDGDVTNWIFHNRKDRVEALYTNMRAKFADLADTSAKIRTYIDRINNAVIYKTTQEKPEEIIKDFNNTFIKNKETSVNVKYYNSNNKIEWLDSYIDAYKTLSNKNPYFGVIVNYNNSAHINNINLTKKIREQLFGLKSKNRFNEGELLIVDNNTLNAGLGTLGKDMRVYVESINETKRKQNFSYRQKGVRVEKYFSIEFDAYQITATTDGEDVFTFYVPIINETVLEKYKNQDFDFLNIKGEKPENINQLIAIIDPHIAQVSYGYVVNSHKVQGSSYDQVWVQEDNILTAREPKEVLQLLYTAYSRPKYKTHSLNNSSSVEIKEIFEPLKTESKEQPAITEQIGEKQDVKGVNEELIPTKKEITKEDTDKLPPCIG